MNFGNHIEEILSKLLSEPLLQDFVHLRPIILHEKKRELCDILIEDEPSAILLQLKVQDLTKANENRDQKRWAIKQLTKAESQVKGAIKYMSLSDISCSNTVRGEIRFNKDQLHAKHGIVVIDFDSVPFLLDDKFDSRTKMNVPIHYLTYSDFILLCQNLKTLPDLISYLEERAKIPKWARPLLGDEKNVYAYYLMHKSTFSYSIIRGDFNNKWCELTINYKKKFSGKVYEDGQTELFQKVLKELYNHDPIVSQLAPSYVAKIGNVSDPDRVEISRSLNRIRLLLRRAICKKLWEKLELSDTSKLGYNYFSIASKDKKTMFFFLCSRHNREKRLEELQIFSTTIYDLHKDINRVIGIATENLHSATGRSFDYILIEGIVREQDEDFLKEAKHTFFKNMEYISLHDFPDENLSII
ncbi:MAG: hypothetical protein EHM58_02455 [Ignavibacteriae bacterium]|nr:MAG: hypothetical protein EHM58_02455 [Ignavibacteriota bacterium]